METFGQLRLKMQIIKLLFLGYLALLGPIISSLCVAAKKSLQPGFEQQLGKNNYTGKNPPPAGIIPGQDLFDLLETIRESADA